MKRGLLTMTAMMLLSISLIMGCGGGTSHSSDTGSIGGNTNTEVESEVGDSLQEDTTELIGMDDSENVPDNAMELLEDALNGNMVSEEELTPSGELTNAISNATYITIMDDQGDRCKLKITYPDVKSAFLEALEMLPADVDEQGKKAFYDSLREKVENGEITTLETTLEMDILTDSEGRKYLDWTREAMSATTGGLSDVYYDMLEGISE